MSRSSKKGPWVEDRLMERIEQMNSVRLQDHDQDLVADLHDLPRDGRPHDRRARRAQARPGVRVRVDGRPQARRVRADAHVPRAREVGQGAMSDEARQEATTRSSGPTRRPRARPPPPRRPSRPPPAPRPRRPPRRPSRPPRRRARPPRTPPSAEAQARTQGARGRGRRRRGRAGRRRGRRPRRSAKPRAKKAAERRGRRDDAEADAEGRGEAAAKKPRREDAAAQEAEPRPRSRRRAPALQARPAPPGRAGVTVRAQAKYVRTSARKARLVCDHIRGKDVARGARDPRLHAARGGEGLGEAARVRRRQRRAQPRAGRRGAAHRGRLRRRGPDAEALPAARHGPRHAHPQAHLAPDDHAHPEGALEHGAEGTSRSHARGLHPRLEVELVQRAPLLRLPDRGRAHPRPHHRQARARRPVGHHDPQGRRRGRGQHPHRPARAS